MQQTSALYKQIVALDSHWFVHRLVIDSVGTFGESVLFGLETSRQAVNGKPEIGKAVAGEINIKMLEPSTAIPRMGTLRPQYKAVGIINGVETSSEWLPKGTFFVDTREYTESGGDSFVTMHGYDAIAKTEADYPNTSHNWPFLDKSVVAEIATTIGVSVDPRTNQYLTAGYMIDLPIGYTMRETLEHIAAAYGGNFVMTAENKLLFVPLYGLDYEIEAGNYLADENGNALTYGNEGWFILV